MWILCFFFFKQKTAYEMRISDWSSDVCSSDLLNRRVLRREVVLLVAGAVVVARDLDRRRSPDFEDLLAAQARAVAVPQVQLVAADPGQGEAVGGLCQLGGLHECLVDRIEQVVGVGGVSVAAVEIRPQHQVLEAVAVDVVDDEGGQRSEEHTSELQSLMRISYAVFCLKKNKKILT